MSEAGDRSVIEESRRQVARLATLGWYHSIELPDGHVIEGHQSLEQLRRRVNQFPIPQDLRGTRVLDIGAWDGWFSFEMERRGAEVLAVDSTRNTRLLEARSLLGSKIGYRVADICRLTSADVGTFDIVLFLGVLYHLKHPLLALENVCGLCRDVACIESFVTDADPHAPPVMEFYETMELRGQLDNWVGPNAACLLAMTRAAGFARVQFESVLGERAHITAYRRWAAAPGNAAAPVIQCVENSATHDHRFSAATDDYMTFYFTSVAANLTCDNVYPAVGEYGSRPIHVAPTGAGWQATCKIPPSIAPGWHAAALSTKGSAVSASVRIGIDAPEYRQGPLHPTVRITRVADGHSFEDKRIHTGENSAISLWAEGLIGSQMSVRLNGTDCPAVWISPPDGDRPRQVNALLPSGLQAGPASVALAIDNMETRPVEVELWQSS